MRWHYKTLTVGLVLVAATMAPETRGCSIPVETQAQRAA